jgi:hypothetical protein
LSVIKESMTAGTYYICRIFRSRKTHGQQPFFFRRKKQGKDEQDVRITK